LLSGPLAGPHVIIGYAWDAAAGALSTVLRTTLHSGPERGVHVLGWWRGVSRLRDDLGGAGARFDAIGAWVALDVQGSELTPLCPTPAGRPGIHGRPGAVLRPYGAPGGRGHHPVRADPVTVDAYRQLAVHLAETVAVRDSEAAQLHQSTVDSEAALAQRLAAGQDRVTAAGPRYARQPPPPPPPPPAPPSPSRGYRCRSHQAMAGTVHSGRSRAARRLGPLPSR